MEVDPGPVAPEPIQQQPHQSGTAPGINRPTFSAVTQRAQKQVCDRVYRTFNIQVPQFKYVTRVGVVRSLSSKILLSKVEAVVRQPTGWQVTTTTLDGIRGLVGDLEIEGTKCHVSPVAEKDAGGGLVWIQPYVMVRVHWLPYYLDDEVLKDSLGIHGKIVSITDERGLDGIPNGVKRVRMEIKDMGLFPHMLRCWFGGKTFTGLITVPGRAPLCLRCKQVGHVRGTCPLNRPVGREEEPLVIDEHPAQAPQGPRVVQAPAVQVVAFPLAPAPSVVPVVPVPAPVPVVATPAPAPGPALAVSVSEEGSSQSASVEVTLLAGVPLSPLVIPSVSQEAPVSEKRRTEGSPGGVDGGQGEEGATPKKRRGRPSRAERSEEDQGSQEPWITVGGARGRSGRSPSSSPRLCRHVPVQVMPAPPSRPSARGREDDSRK